MPDNDPDATMKLPDAGAPLSAGELLARALNTPGPSVGDGRWTPPAPEELAALLPQYQIESLLGHGGMGAVYKGRQAALDRPVAIKLLPAEMAADAQFIARFQREARTLAKLQHPGIVAVHDFGQTSEGHLYFVMEFVDGTDLHRILQAPGGLNPAQALELISQICDALHYAHGKGVIHRDIKPGNILVTTDSRAKLADFGLARPIKDESTMLTGTNVIMGTAAYMAPEQQEGRSDQRADIYALGVMLYEMLCGQRPSGAFDPPSHRVQVDVRLDDVVIKAMQQQPERRYQQVSEMKTDVDRIRTTPPKMGRRKKPESGQPQGGTPEPQRRKTLTIAAIIAACLALAGVAGLNIWEKVNHPALAGGSKGTDAAAGGESEASGSARASRAVSGAPPETSNGGRAPQRVQSVDSPAKTPAAPGGAPAAAREARALHNPSIATATKDAPFVNSLGMKFVPVPITGGPTGGQRVLFSVWETRVQDYEAFAKETKREWLTPKFEQGSTHPAVMVTWHDATAFCAWLTAQEQKSGKLAANWCYRLPRNEEWSRALGIGGDDFLWGPQWPPPDKTANFESEELRAAFAAGSYPNPLNAESQLPGYRDGFAETAPVGSFRANPLGLYDLEGNVIEWCDDWEDDSKVRRTNRGAAWKMSGKLQLRASSRVFYPPEARGDFIGFRVVLVPGR